MKEYVQLESFLRREKMRPSRRTTAPQLGASDRIVSLGLVEIAKSFIGKTTNHYLSRPLLLLFAQFTWEDFSIENGQNADQV